MYGDSQKYLADMLQQDIDNSQYEEPAMYGFARTNNMDDTTLDIVNNDNCDDDGSDDDDDATIMPVLSTQSRARLSFKLDQNDLKSYAFILLMS
ncbi:hypothetical protein PHYBLDRAFT_139109 [Phycomyces blakesleeanus NRRL 1555(-)]|uniref:Uncharacterized protein n=1 Tax=Phycomyces blakesleeanus (strain ATCC 8743b / DSM 1359 / FGSC 10004 / NBRC 33097 / NRRL 1555) TaxID=763407 RepID=A0A162VC53_PHYB8|nr:hypothetical protein PHYBLDRAFT_139109 [Phycomyces blakesleeanus NRRL 1555(-)]OAD81562.1 hypothetical protein PHYBLDRAFT_139109 [Phycomyces blakesleeanus NRRL 1555(-)]|eukprot:XP_018299602.1 hypothetical protein PHYBLDRAFT_139109 [Phycomyces blakesleeanus NRRL 1555(-)]